jgi:tetratricopeptide (TPR) repeat protein
MTSRLWRSWMFAVLVGFAPASATAAGSDQPANDNAALARALSDAGLAHFKKGDYNSALEAFVRSYELSPEPALLFNMAQSLRKKGDCRQALDHYRRFAAADPTAATGAKVAAHIKDMETCSRLSTPPTDTQTDLATQDKPMAASLEPTASVQSPPALSPKPTVPVLPLAAVPTKPVSDGRGLRVGGIVVGSTGIAALALGVLASLKVASIEQRVSSDFVDGGPLPAGHGELISQGQRYELASQMLYAGGTLALLTGATLYYFGVRQTHGAWRIALTAPSSVTGGAVSVACPF